MKPGRNCRAHLRMHLRPGSMDRARRIAADNRANHGFILFGSYVLGTDQGRARSPSAEPFRSPTK